MTEPKTYKLLGRTVKIVPDTTCTCIGCMFEGHSLCPTKFDELEAGIEQTCLDGKHKYVEVQAGVQECGK